MKAQKAREWLLKAKRDLSLAKLALAEPETFEPAIFHCQQCAEKALKGFLTFHDVRFQKTHSLETLIYQAEPIDATFLDCLSLAQSLSPFATEFRYPDGLIAAPLGRDEFEEAIRNAETIYQFVLNKLPEEARP